MMAQPALDHRAFDLGATVAIELRAMHLSDDAHVQRLLASGTQLAEVRDLVVTGLATSTLEDLFEPGRLPNLERLEIGELWLESAAALIFTRARCARYVAIELRSCGFGASDVARLATRELPNLVDLVLVDGPILAHGVRALATSRAFPALRRLHLQHGRLSQVAAELLLEAHGWPALASVWCDVEGEVDDARLAAAIEASSLPIANIRLRDAMIGPAVARALARRGL